jgi:hypothetical protein
MPTGYTSDLYDGTPVAFPEFAMRCARAFGALVTMRDSSMDAPVPEEFKPSSHHSDKLAALREERVRLGSRTPGEWLAAYDAHVSEVGASNAAAAAESNERRRRYEAMIAEVEHWEPPSTDHRDLKDFMLSQLRESIDFDCNVYPREPDAPDARSYADAEFARIERETAYHEYEDAAERERTVSRNAWVKKLRESLADGAGVVS